ncbi:MAG TPA: glycosyltransferase [Opitutaceae bacterium]|nr:glycosyltransferase [Opitutaceae bacterium]
MSESPPQPRIVAGITTRNRAPILPRALDSLRAAGRDGLRIVVLDDGSTDGTSALAARYPEFEWRRHETARGIIESRNELMREADAKYFLCLDDDAWFVRGDELALAIARLEADPRIAAIAFDILSPDRPAESPRGRPRPTTMYIGCGHVLRLSAVREAGFYAATPGVYGSEEKDLCLRLADRGYRVELLPGVHVWHEKAWSGRDNRPLHRSGVCNELVMTVRRCPLPALLAVLPAKLFSYLGFWIRRPHYFAAGVAGVLDAVRHGPMAWRTRHPVRVATFWRFTRGR